ncbi:MAG: DUF937 domain-containing protein [Acidimicrobiales bacterium]
MADLLDVLGGALDDRAVSALASSLGIDADDAGKLVAAALPVLIERLGANAKSGDAGNIASAVAKDHDGALLANAAGFLGGGFKGGPGVAILNHVFGDQIDDALVTVSTATGLPTPVVRLGFTALAPMVLGAITQAAIGAVTAVVVIKLLDVAVDQVRSGRAQALIGRVNASLDDDGDGNALDDVGRSAVDVTKKVGVGLATTTAKVARSDRTKSAAKTGAKVAIKGGTVLAKTGGKLLKKGLGRFRKRK